ncbi:MAG: chemotaxis protein CheW [bacterium]
MSQKRTLKKKVSKSPQNMAENILKKINRESPSPQERGFAIFAVGNEWYSVDMDSIFEILHDFEISGVSHLPDFFEGVTDLRGESIPVVNLKNLLGIEPGETDSQVCLISEFDNKKTGFLIDSDIEIVRSSDIQFFALPDCYSAEEKKFLEGIIEHKNKLIGVLKFNQVLKTLSERRSDNEDK